MKIRFNNKFLAAASYLPPVFAPLLILKSADSLIFFHARQALWIWLIFAAAFGTALLPGRFLALFKWPISITLALVFLYLLINGVVDALRAKSEPLPPLGNYVQKRRLLENLRKS